MGFITLQFCAFDSLVAHFIEWGTQAIFELNGYEYKVGHVDVVMASGELLGAQNENGLGGKPAGVQLRPGNYGATSGMINPVRVNLPTSEECANAAYAWALSMIGTPYDFEAIEGILVGKNWARLGHLICSGLASGMLTQPAPAFIGHELARVWRIITPAQLLLLCSGFAPVVLV